MTSKWKFFDFRNYLQKTAFKTKIASLKDIACKVFFGDSSRINFKNFLINKITKSYTSIINYLFIAITVAACLSAITYSYYEQRQKFELNLLNKSKELAFQIEELINNYKSSMNALAHVLLIDDLYKQDDQVVQLLKLTHIEDEHLMLLPLTFNLSLKPYKSYSVHGFKEVDPPDHSFINKLKQNSEKFIYDNNDKRKQQNLTLHIPLLSHNKEPNLLGYLSLPINIQTILNNVQVNISNEELLKVIRQEKTQYFIKQQGYFDVSSAIPDYGFSKAITISNLPYEISVGANEETILHDTLQISLERCSIILFMSITMLLIYNYFERRKLRKQCNELFTQEVYLLNEQLEELKTSNQLDHNKTRKFLLFENAIKVISILESRFKQKRDKTIDAIEEVLELKDHKDGDELTIDIVKNLFENIYTLSKNLKNNIVCTPEDVIMLDLSQLISEVIPIFNPVLEERNITLTNNVKNITLSTNDILFKQILISLIARNLCFIPENGIIDISAIQDKTRNMLTLEITDNGISIDDVLFKNMSKNRLPCDMSNILLDFNIIEKLIKEDFNGNIHIISDHEGNHITILLPIELNEASKVIPMTRIMGAKR